MYLFAIGSFASLLPGWRYHSISALAWEENVLRGHSEVAPALCHRSQRSGSEQWKTGHFPWVGYKLSSFSAKAVQLSLWMVVHFSCWCSESVICITEPKLTRVAPRTGSRHIPHCVFHLQDTDGALSSGKDLSLHVVPVSWSSGIYRWAKVTPMA